MKLDFLKQYYTIFLKILLNERFSSTLSPTSTFSLAHVRKRGPTCHLIQLCSYKHSAPSFQLPKTFFQSFLESPFMWPYLKPSHLKKERHTQISTTDEINTSEIFKLGFHTLNILNGSFWAS